MRRLPQFSWTPRGRLLLTRSVEVPRTMGRVGEMQRAPQSVAKAIEKIRRRGGRHALEDDELLLGSNLLDLLDRDHDQLTPEPSAPHLEHVGSIDPGHEPHALDEANGAFRRLDLEPLAAGEETAPRVVWAHTRAVVAVLSSMRQRRA